MDDKDRKSAKKLIFRKLRDVPAELISLSSSTTPATTAIVRFDSLQKLAIVCGNHISFQTQTTNQRLMTLDEEISAYVEAARSATNFQQFWISYESHLPRLSCLVRRVNIIPATSLSSESLFSIANFLSRKQRSGLSSRTLRYLTVLKNRHLLEKLESSF